MVIVAIVFMVVVILIMLVTVVIVVIVSIAWNEIAVGSTVWHGSCFSHVKWVYDWIDRWHGSCFNHLKWNYDRVDRLTRVLFQPLQMDLQFDWPFDTDPVSTTWNGITIGLAVWHGSCFYHLKWIFNWIDRWHGSCFYHLEWNYDWIDRLTRVLILPLGMELRLVGVLPREVDLQVWS